MTSANTMSLKKKMIIALCAVVGVIAIVVTTVFTTVAYLSASSSVSNVFTVGGVEITMDEAAVNPNGQYITNKDNRRDMNSYHLVPGATYIKDPVIHVQPNSERSYLFITVKNDIAPLAAAGATTIAAQLTTKGWAQFTQVQAGTVYVYVGAAKAKQLAGDNDVAILPSDAVAGDVLFTEYASTITDYPLFESFTIRSDVTTADIKPYGAAKITINAFAIQDVGLSTVALAWEAIVANYGSYLNLVPVTPTDTPEVQG